MDRSVGGPAETSVNLTFDRAALTAGSTLVQDVAGGQYSTPGGLTYLEGHSGVSLRQLITAGAHVDVDSVASVDIDLLDAGGSPASGRLVASLSDLAAPTEPGFPFRGGLVPYFTYDGSDLLFAVNARTTAPPDPSIMDGRFLQALPGQSLSVTLHLTSTIQAVRVTAAADAIQLPHATARLSAHVDDLDVGDAATFSWDFGDGKTGVPGVTVSHEYTVDGSFQVTVTVQTHNGSRGSATAVITVRPAVPPTSPPPTSPKPTVSSRGTGGSAAPNIGPNTGSGARVGGVPTDRPGSGRAGATFDPRSASPSVSGGGSAPPTDGQVVGYLLSDGTVVSAPAAQAGATPRDDSAPAARDGVSSNRLAGWVLAIAVVVALLVLGAGSERRRPRRAGRRR